jgi:hypothetical protein
MRRFLTLTLALAAIATPAAAQSDREQILATVNSLFDAMRARDTAAMAQHVDTLTRFTLLRPNQAGGSRVMILRPADFARAVTNPNQPPLDERIRNPVVHIDGDLATVWAEYQVRRDGKVTHCGYDAFHLAKLGGKWKILNVSDTFRQTGCGDAWPVK